MQISSQVFGVLESPEFSRISSTFRPVIKGEKDDSSSQHLISENGTSQKSPLLQAFSSKAVNGSQAEAQVWAVQVDFLGWWGCRWVFCLHVNVMCSLISILNRPSDVSERGEILWPGFCVQTLFLTSSSSLVGVCSISRESEVGVKVGEPCGQLLWLWICLWAGWWKCR